MKMKSKLYLCIVMILLLTTTSACTNKEYVESEEVFSDSEVQIEQSIEEKLDESENTMTANDVLEYGQNLISVEIKGVSSSEIKLTYTNHTNIVLGADEAGFYLEEDDLGVWKERHTLPDISWADFRLLQSIKPHLIFEEELDFDFYYGGLESGHYRLVRIFAHEQQEDRNYHQLEIKVYVEFEIDN